MTQDDITRLAGHRLVSPWVMKLACDVANEEREKCAKIAEAELYNTTALTSMPQQSSAAWNILQAIRARGEFK